MVDTVRLAELRDTPLSVDEVLSAVVGSRGRGHRPVRRHGPGSRSRPPDVVRLGYSAHPSAAAELRRVAEKVAASFGVTAVAAVHRVGDLEVGDLAVVAAVACPHRGEAFDACRALIDELKQAVPIWKHQQFAGGESEWVNSA